MVAFRPRARARSASHDRTFRRRYLRMPGRLTRTARQWTLHLPKRWPWQDTFAEALAKIKAIPALA